VPFSSSFTRRAVVAQAAALPLATRHLVSKADPAIAASQTWLACRAEHDRLGQRWQEIEDRLFRQHNWSRLTRAQRNRFPEKREMDALYDRMDELHEENLALLASLPTIIATTRWGVCGKLAVASIEVCPEDYPEAHQLIESILRDYRALHGG
jgi:hypothetical protein